MPRNFQYSRRRFLVMQGCMWGILLLTIGGAALVDRRHSLGGNVILDRVVDIGHVSLELPSTWTSSDGGDVIRLVEPVRPEWARSIIVKRRSTSWLEGLFAVGNPRPISFGELGEGVLVTSLTAQRISQDGGSGLRVQLMARVDLPGGDILEIALTTQTDSDSSIRLADISLIKGVAASARRTGDDEAP